MGFQNGSGPLQGSKWHSTSTQINRKINCPVSNNTYNVGTKTYPAAQVLQTGNIYMYNILHLTCNVSRGTLHIFQHWYICQGWRVFEVLVKTIHRLHVFSLLFWEVAGRRGPSRIPSKINTLQQKSLSMLNHHMQKKNCLFTIPFTDSYCCHNWITWGAKEIWFVCSAYKQQDHL